MSDQRNSPFREVKSPKNGIKGLFFKKDALKIQDIQKDTDQNDSPSESISPIRRRIASSPTNSLQIPGTMNKSNFLINCGH